LILSATTLLGGCATASFAPPPVRTAEKVRDMSLIDCRPAEGSNARIDPDVIGATDLIQNFVYAYRCASAEAANGRQIFQVPSFLSAATAAVGATFGLNNDQVLSAGIAAATLNGGQSYYVPQEKSKVIGAALGAVLCVKSEAAGIPYFRTRADNPPKPQEAKAALEAAYAKYQGFVAQAQSAREQRAAVGMSVMSEEAKADEVGQLDRQITAAELMAETSLADVKLAAKNAIEAYGTGSVSFDAERQYFEMVSSALYSIEKILAGRLRDIGTQDLANVFARYKELQKEAEAREAAAKKAKGDAQNAAVKALGGARADVSAAEMQAKEVKTLSNEALQPRLQICVLQAHDT
jgi:hypothetical protein